MDEAPEFELNDTLFLFSFPLLFLLDIRSLMSMHQFFCFIPTQFMPRIPSIIFIWSSIEGCIRNRVVCYLKN